MAVVSFLFTSMIGMIISLAAFVSGWSLIAALLLWSGIGIFGAVLMIAVALMPRLHLLSAKA